MISNLQRFERKREGEKYKLGLPLAAPVCAGRWRQCKWFAPSIGRLFLHPWSHVPCHAPTACFSRRTQTAAVAEEEEEAVVPATATTTTSTSRLHFLSFQDWPSLSSLATASATALATATASRSRQIAEDGRKISLLNQIVFISRNLWSWWCEFFRLPL